MLRVGLTGELGSGKSTVAQMLAERGAIVLSSDEIARAMMRPGQAVYAQIVERFGREIVQADGSLDRGALAKLAFDPQHPRVEELNAIIHPAVIAEQARAIAEIARTQPNAIVVVESALIFSTKYGSGGWRERFDCVVVVTARDEVKMERFIARLAGGRSLSPSEALALRADARQRLLAQRVPVPEYVNVLRIENNSAVEDLKRKVEDLWETLIASSRAAQNS